MREGAQAPSRRPPILAVACVLLCVAACLRPMPAQDTWAKVYQVTGYMENLLQALPAGAGEILVCTDNGNLMRLNCRGDILWNFRYDLHGQMRLALRSVTPLREGGLLIAAVSGVGNNALIWTDANGLVIRHHFLEPSVRGAVETSDGSLLLVGTLDLTGGEMRLWAGRLSANGDHIWDRTYGVVSRYATPCVVQTEDGGFLLGSSNLPSDYGTEDFWLIKVDPQGAILWQRAIGGSGEDLLQTLVRTGPDRYAACGRSTSLGPDGYSTWVVSLDGSGTVLGQEAYRGDGQIRRVGASALPGGGLLISGPSTDPSTPVMTAWDAFRLDAEGGVLWARRFRGSIYSDWPDSSSAFQTEDGGFLIPGTTLDRALPPRLESSPFLVKLDGNGNADGTCSFMEPFLISGEGTTIPAYDTSDPASDWQGPIWTDAVTVSTPSIPSRTLCDSLGGCALACSAKVPPSGGPGEDLPFTSSVAAAPGCAGGLTYAWDFGDGSGLNHDAQVRHAYAAPGRYVWTFRASAGGRSCASEGIVDILTTPPSEYTWARAITGAPGKDESFGDGSVSQRGDGSFFGTGVHGFWNRGDALLSVFALDREGGFRWQEEIQILSNLNTQFGPWKRATADGGMAVLGAISEEPRFFLLKLDATGNVEWGKRIGSEYEAELNAFDVTPDGGFVLAGTIHPSPGGGTAAGWGLRLDRSGNILWSHAIQGDYYLELFSVRASAGGGYLAAGTLWAGDGVPVLVRLDEFGNILWQRLWRGSHVVGFYRPTLCMVPGGCLLAWTGALSDVEGGFFCTLVHDDGTVAWQKFGGANSPSPLATALCQDGGFIILAGAYGSSWLVRLGSAGQIAWARRSPTLQLYSSAAFSVQETADGGFLFSAEASRSVIVKTDSQGWEPSCTFLEAASASTSDAPLMVEESQAVISDAPVAVADLAATVVPGTASNTMLCSGGGARCTLDCGAQVTEFAVTFRNAAFTAVVTPDGCNGERTFEWSFGDGSAPSQEMYASHAYQAPGTFDWTLCASMPGTDPILHSGTIQVAPGPPLPGDCDGNGTVSIGEVQKAINMFLGTQAPGCGVDCNADGAVSIGEVQKVINAFLGVSSSC